MSLLWRDTVLDYWFGLDPARWWQGKAIDAEVRARFEDLWRAERGRPAEDFTRAAEDALAAVILFDQFPRNMFRGEACAFATDGLARAITEAALARGLDRELEGDRRLFLLMPLEHSEDEADQARAVALIGAIGQPQALDFARKHQAMIARFGRFPARNAALGRESTAQEIAAGCPEPF